MTSEQLAIFEEIVAQCLSGRYASINVGSKKRSWAIVAIYEQVNELKTQVAELHGTLHAALLPLEAAADALVPEARVKEAAALVEEAIEAIREGLEENE